MEYGVWDMRHGIWDVGHETWNMGSGVTISTPSNDQR